VGGRFVRRALAWLAVGAITTGVVVIFLIALHPGFVIGKVVEHRTVPTPMPSPLFSGSHSCKESTHGCTG
jgi:hypothetical protein